MANLMMVKEIGGKLEVCTPEQFKYWLNSQYTTTGFEILDIVSTQEGWTLHSEEFLHNPPLQLFGPYGFTIVGDEAVEAFISKWEIEAEYVPNDEEMGYR